MDVKRWFTAAVAAGVAATAVPVHQAQADDHDEINITAEDVPDALTHQGRLIDDEGQPITGEVELTYTLWDHPTEGAVVWQDVIEADVDETGFYSVELGGDANPIDAAVVADGQGWLGVNVDGGDELEPRISLNAVPYALIAEEALRANYAEAADVAVEATFAEVADEVRDGAIGSDALADDFELEPQHVESATGQTLGGLACSSGEVARFDGTNWGCDDTVAEAEWAEEAAHAEEADEAEWAEEAAHAEEADEAEWAEIAAGVEAGSIDESALAPGFDISPDQFDGDTLEGLACSSGEVARFDGNVWFCDEAVDDAVTAVTATGPIASTGGDEPNISIARADANTSGYLHAEDFSSFDDRVESVEEGDGISIAGSDASPEVHVEFGDQPGTVVEGDDERLDDERDPLPGSDHYIQNDPGSTQAASFDISGDSAIEGALEVGDDDDPAHLEVFGDFRFTGGDEYGLSSDYPASSCLDILENNPTVEEGNDGIYWIEPYSRAPASAFEVYCDMTTDGGGWTLITTEESGASGNINSFKRFDRSTTCVNGLCSCCAYESIEDDMFHIGWYNPINSNRTGTQVRFELDTGFEFTEFRGDWTAGDEIPTSDGHQDDNRSCDSWDCYEEGSTDQFLLFGTPNEISKPGNIWGTNWNEGGGEEEWDFDEQTSGDRILRWDVSDATGTNRHESVSFYDLEIWVR